MGLLGFTSTVTTTYRADVSDHIKELQKLKGEEKAAAKQQLDNAKATNDALEGQIKTLGKITIAVGATVAVAKGAWNAYQHVVEKSRLETAAMGVDIGRLQQASGGLKTRMDLLRDAALLQQSAFKLSGSQMVSVEKAMLSLTRAGFAQEEVTKKVTEAIVKLDGGGLKDFGIHVREATSNGDKFAAVMQAIEARAKGVDTSAADSSESVQKMGVQFKNSMDQIETSIGRIVIALGPLIERVGGLMSTIAGAAEGEDNWLGRLSGSYSNLTGAFRGAAASTAATSIIQGRRVDPTALRELEKMNPDLARYLMAMRKGLTAEEEARQAGIQEQVDYLLTQQANIDENARKEGRRKRTPGPATRAQAWRNIQVVDASGNAAGMGPGAAGYQGFGGGNDSAIDGFDIRQGLANIGNEREGAASAEMKRLRDGVEEFQRLAAEAQKGREKSFLTAAFGTPEEINLLRDSFGVLSASVGTALSAWLNGSEKFGAAFKKAIGSGLAALATDYGVKALGEVAWGIGTAFTNPAESATHFASAAAYGAAAIAAGAGAKLLGGGGGSNPAAGGASAGARGAAPTLPAGGGIQRTERTIVIGNSFAEDTPRMRQLKAERLWNDAKGSGGTVYS